MLGLAIVILSSGLQGETFLHSISSTGTLYNIVRIVNGKG